MTNRNEYMVAYRAKHRTKLRKYNMLWMRKWREKNREEVREYAKEQMRLYRERQLIRKLKKIPRCKVCGILLRSPYAGKHNGKRCEDCLKKS